MYLVELRPGKEELYRTGDELAAAIRNGDVDTHSRIYHRATSKWISVTLHPQYKAIVSAQRPADPPLAPLERQTWTFFNDPTDELAGAHDPEPPAADSKQGGDVDPNQPWRRPLALSVTGGLLILGLQLAASGPRPPWSTHEAAATAVPRVAPASMVSAGPRTPTVSLAARWTDVSGAASVGQPAEAQVAEAPTPAPAFELPAAPKLRAHALLRATQAVAPAAARSETATVDGLLARWSAAHDAARERLESGVRVARLGQLFSAGRLNPAGGVAETRMSLAGMANFVRVYRQQQTTIEREWQDSFTVASKARAWTPAALRAWYARPSRMESPALAAMTSSLLEQIDSLFGVLDAQAGTYTLTRNTIRFEDASAARAYGELRSRIMTELDSVTVAAMDQSGPMGYLLQAIGATRLPLAT